MQAVRRWAGLAAAVTPVMVAATLVCGSPGALAAPSPAPVLTGTGETSRDQGQGEGAAGDCPAYRPHG